MLPLPEISTATRRSIARKYKLPEATDLRPFLHIRCGGDILGRLDEAGIPGARLAWGDAVCEGPLHHPHEEPLRQQERAAYLAQRYFLRVADVLRGLKAADTRLRDVVHFDETVLWFEADLFDQAILAFLLSSLRPLARRIRISLISVGAFPGIDRFIGLGQLSPGQLASLFPGRRPVSRRQFEQGTRAWEALNAARPDELCRIARLRRTALPFLPAAMQRYLAEYPSTVNGLSRSQQLALEEVAAGARSPEEAFVRAQRREERPFMGDSMFYAALRDLASGDRPLLAGALPRIARLRDPEFQALRIWLTPDGRRVLQNGADWCELSGAVRQMGGVTLRGAAPRWRWDPDEERLVERRRRRRIRPSPF